jgi:hypothetical protein
VSIPPEGTPPLVPSGAQLRRARTLVLAAGLVVASGVAGCLALAPRPIDVSDGMSWFGVTPSTLEVYGLTLLLTAGLLGLAGRALTDATVLRPLRGVLLAAAVLLPALLATPYTESPAMNWTHMTVGSVLFVLQLWVVGWLWWSRHRTPAALALLAVQTAAGVVCFFSVLDLAETMLYGQLVFQAAFTASVVSGLGAELRRGEARGGRVHGRVRVRRH